MPCYHKFLPFSLLIFVLSCPQCKQEQPQTINGKELFTTKESYMRANRYLVQKDAEQIKGYVERRGWDMTQTKTGLWYMIYGRGTGIKAGNGKKIVFNFTTTLLDGSLCYSSQESGPKEFIIGQGGVESGLEEGVLLLGVGDKAKFIIPPHLGYGLLGDNNKIPPRAIVLYDIEVLTISEP